jgi:hypothetical protein
MMNINGQSSITIRTNHMIGNADSGDLSINKQFLFSSRFFFVFVVFFVFVYLRLKSEMNELSSRIESDCFSQTNNVSSIRIIIRVVYYW